MRPASRTFRILLAGALLTSSGAVTPEPHDAWRGLPVRYGGLEPARPSTKGGVASTDPDLLMDSDPR